MIGEQEKFARWVIQDRPTEDDTYYDRFMAFLDLHKVALSVDKTTFYHFFRDAVEFTKEHSANRLTTECVCGEETFHSFIGFFLNTQTTIRAFTDTEETISWSFWRDLVEFYGKQPWALWLMALRMEESSK